MPHYMPNLESSGVNGKLIRFRLISDFYWNILPSSLAGPADTKSIIQNCPSSAGERANNNNTDTESSYFSYFEYF